MTHLQNSKNMNYAIVSIFQEGLTTQPLKLFQWGTLKIGKKYF